MTETAIVWFRRDLRLADNSALAGALRQAHALGDMAAILPIWVLPAEIGTGEASWLAHSLAALDADLRQRGSGLVLRSDPITEVLPALANECDALSVHCTRVWTPSGLAEEREVEQALSAKGVRLIVAEGSLLVTPDGIATAAGGPYKVFSPYFTAWQRAWHSFEPATAPEHIPAPETPVASEPLPSLRTYGPDPIDHWKPGETGAHERLEAFLTDTLPSYEEARDVPALDATSRLSPHLAFGEMSPHQIVTAVARSHIPEVATKAFLRQLAWREFAAHVLHHNPHTLAEPLRPEFARMPWRDDPDALDEWRTGRTGFPLVDAGMRQLSATGWMHNRVRLVAASLLTKHLLVPWQTGEQIFAETLVDVDMASNVFNWQWVSGCGADAAPYFRIFNPTLQAKRFDPEGTYIRRWVPELQRVPSRWIAEPWKMPPADGQAVGMRLGTDYPEPLVDHQEARDRALAAYAAIRS